MTNYFYNPVSGKTEAVENEWEDEDFDEFDLDNENEYYKIECWEDVLSFIEERYGYYNEFEEDDYFAEDYLNGSTILNIKNISDYI